MFFNVGISTGGLSNDHQNEITASRTFDGNEKRRNPGGGTNNRIGESTMSFCQQNKFFAQSQNSFEASGCNLRQYGKRVSGGKRDNSAYTESRRHFHYHSNKPKRIYHLENTSFQRPTRDYNKAIDPDEVGNMASNMFSPGLYRTQVTETGNPLALRASISHHGNYRNSEYYTNLEESSQAEAPLGNVFSYPDDPPEIDYRRDYGTPLPRGSENPRRRNKQREISGSPPPEYQSNYTNSNFNHHSGFEFNNPYYNSDKLYDRYYNVDEYFNDRYVEEGHEASDQYKYRPDYEYYEERRPSLPLPIPQPKQCRRYRNPSASYSGQREESERYHKPEKNYSGKNSESKRYRNNEIHSYRIDREVPDKNYRHDEDAFRRYDNVSKEISRLSSPKKYHCSEPIEIFRPDITNSHAERKYWPDRKSRRKYKNDSSKKHPREYFRNRSRHPELEEIPRSQKLSGTDSWGHPNQYVHPRECNRLEKRKHHKSTPNQKKFGYFADSNIGNDIPHRFLEKTRTPSSIFFTIEIPYKKKDRGHSTPPKNWNKRRGSGCDTIAQDSVSACELNKELSEVNSHRKKCSAFELNKEPTEVKCHRKIENVFKPHPSLFDVETRRCRKTIKQKISGFLKRSKLCLKRSTNFKRKSKVMKSSCKSLQGHLNGSKLSVCNLLGRSTTVSRKQERNMSSGPNILKGKAGSSPRNEDFSRNSNECFIEENDPCKHDENGSHQYFCKKARESRYPTVYRNWKKDRENEDKYQQYSMYNFVSSNHRCRRSRPESEQYDHGLASWRTEYIKPKIDKVVSPRVSSGNCSLYSEDRKNENESSPSQINVCLTIRAEDLSLTGNPRIVSSKVIRGSRLSNEDVKMSVSNVSLTRKESDSDAFRSVRFSTTSCSSRSNSSQNCSFMAENGQVPCKRKTIESCSRPPGRTSPGRRSSGSSNSCRRLRSKTSSNSNSQKCHIKLNSQCCSKRSRPSVCPRPQSNLNRKSSLKGVSQNCGKDIPKKRVCLNTKTSNYCLPKISSVDDCSGISSLCSGDIRNIKPYCCRRSKSHNANFGGCQRSKVRSGQKPRRCSSAPVTKICSLPPCSPETGSRCSQSTISKDSGSCNRKKTHPENLQLACMHDDCSPRIKCNGSNTSSNTILSSRGKAATTRGDLCYPNLADDWKQKSKYPRSFVEELKRELLLSFRQDQTLEAQRPCFRPTPLMLLPCVPESMRQPNGNLTQTTFCGAEPVVCWAPCSNPQARF